MLFYDAHNHLQDARLHPYGEKIESTLWPHASKPLLAGMVVNGTCEADWPKVTCWAQRHAEIIPSFGYHPWHVQERTPDWRSVLIRHLDTMPSAIGEIGLDRWMQNPDLPAQEEAFVFQLELAAERNLPVTIHCLQAWGRLLELLQTHRRPECGFLLHSYGGSIELVKSLVQLGAYFSFPGYFLHPRKERQRDVFAQIPQERLLVETDAPDQLPPECLIRFPLQDSEGKPLNHPANLPAIYESVSACLKWPLEAMQKQVEENYLRLFGAVLKKRQTLH